jgi:UDP-N-acetylglucosamine enolpyruvyl transferase
MIKLNVVKMLHTMHQMGVEVKVEPTWTREQWCNAVIHQFNIHCMPYPSDSARETAEIVYLVRGFRGQSNEWKRAWNSPPPKRTPPGRVYRTGR